MAKNKGQLSDIYILAICHFVGLVLMSVFGASVFNIVEGIPGSAATYLMLPINRSMWEFSKMLLGPISILFFIEYFIVGRRMKKFIPVHLIIATLIPIASLAVFSFFNYILGSISMQGAQAVFFLALLMGAFLLSILLMTSEIDFTKYAKWVLVVYISLCVLYMVFSFIRPQMRIFFDFEVNTYGPLR